MPVTEEKPVQKELLTVEDIAKALGKTEYTIRKMFRDGELPGVRIGKTWYMRRETWQKFLEDQEQHKR